MRLKKTSDIEFYAIIYNGNYSFLKMNRVIRHYKFKIGLMPLDEYERKYRELYNLGAYTNQVQNYALPLRDKRGNVSLIYITKEFFDTLSFDADSNNSVFENGYVIYLKSTSSLFLEQKNDKVDVGIVFQQIEKFKKFTTHLEHCLRLTRYGTFQFNTHFAFVPNEQKLLPGRKHQNIHLTNKAAIDFVEKDNHLLSFLLNIDNKVSDFLKLALQSFDESFYIKNDKVRFVQLMFCLEVCFKIPSNEPVGHTIARCTSILLSFTKTQFLSLYSEVNALYHIKTCIVNGEIFSEGDENEIALQLNNFISRLEDITRCILQKLIRLNIKSKDELFAEPPIQFDEAFKMMEANRKSYKNKWLVNEPQTLWFQKG